MTGHTACAARLSEGYFHYWGNKTKLLEVCRPMLRCAEPKSRQELLFNNHKLTFFLGISETLNFNSVTHLITPSPQCSVSYIAKEILAYLKG
jgi:hypothetical protein